jgi:putative ABC transport system permease protein
MVNHTELFKLAWGNLIRRKLRSQLTILGIVIGIAAVIALVAMAQGLRTNISSRLATLGGDIMYITPGSSLARGGFGPGVGREFGTREQATTLTLNDVNTVKKISGVKSVSPELRGSTKVSYKNQNISISYRGIEPSKMRDFIPADIVAGRWLLDSDLYSVIIGDSVANTIFKENITIGKTILLNNIEFRVVGILNKSTDVDRTIIIPIKAARELKSNKLASDQVDIIYVKVLDPALVSSTASEIKSALMTLHRVNEDTIDFSITTAETMASATSEISNTLTLFLGGIAAISLIVGGIGVGNTMFMSVLERTREVGILKAIGAKDSSIMELFLMEAALIGLAGGIGGVILGYLLSFATMLAGIPSAVSIEIVGLAVVFSIIIGLAAGYFPAREAAKLEPVQALVYE